MSTSSLVPDSTTTPPSSSPSPVKTSPVTQGNPTKTTSPPVPKKSPPQKEAFFTSSTKYWVIGIFVIIGLLIIIFTVYCYEAWKKQWIPFGEFVTIPPPNAVQPTVLLTYDPTADYPTRDDRYNAAGYKYFGPDDIEQNKEILQDILYNNCYWFCKGQYYRDEDEQTGTLVTSSNKPRISVNVQNISKPSDDPNSKRKGCDCSLYILPADSISTST